MEVCTTHMFYTKNYEKMISVRLNFINMFTKYVYLKYLNQNMWRKCSKNLIKQIAKNVQYHQQNG